MACHGVATSGATCSLPGALGSALGTLCELDLCLMV